MEHRTQTSDFEYYRSMIKNSEIASSPLDDFEMQGFHESYFCYTATDEASRKFLRFLIDTGMDYNACMTALFSILFAKYSNDTAALLTVSVQSAPSVLYADFSETPVFSNFCSDIAQKIRNNAEHTSVGFDELCAEFELLSMPFITSEKNFFDKFSLMDYSGIQAKLCVYHAVQDSRLIFQVKYNSAIYSEATVGRIFSSVEALLSQVSSGQCDIPHLSLLDDRLAAEIDRFNETAHPYDDTVSVTDMLRQAAKKYPDHIAVVFQEKEITYREFDALTDNLAQYISNLGIHTEDVVSILIPRSEYMPVCSVGVLKSGAAYQPLDPGYPADRLKFMMEDASAKLLIADRALLPLVPDYTGNVLCLDEIPALPECTETLPGAKPEDLFILLYTSGSTGVPKGVMLEHRNLVEFCNWFHAYYEMDADSRAAAYASFGFDANMMDMYPALTCGARLYIIEEEIRLDLLRIRQYYEKNKITHAFITTQVGRQYADLFPDSEYPKHLATGGETLVPIEPPTGYKFYNVYGPTECTIYITLFPLDKLYKNVPIGKAMWNVKLYITDKYGQRVPVGVAGELCISGPQVSRGYLNRPEQTKEVFIPNPYTQEKGYGRIYRTGDIVRFLPDGNIEFIGRKDHQVKIRGFRIELSEVEGVIREYEGIQDATVVAYDEAGGGKYIAAYIVSDKEIDISSLNEFIRKTKPAYMVPAVTMQIDKIPLTQNQKVDKRALPVPVRKAQDFVPPQNEMQEKILSCLAKVVGHEEFGITTDFFDAGLTSIGSIKFLVLLSEEFHITVSNRQLKECPTAELLEQLLKSAGKDEEFEKRDRYPLTQTQLGIYVECMMKPEALFYNLPGMFPLSADTDKERLCRALRNTVNAHGTLKCTVRSDENGDVFMYPRDEIEYEIPVLSGTEEEFSKFFADFAKPFDLENGPLFRFAIYQTGQHCYLVCDFHHIICDGSSIAIFVSELDRAMKGSRPEGESYTQFDLAMWEEKARKTDVYEKAKAYYHSLLSDAVTESLPDRDVFEEKEACGHFKAYSPALSYRRVEEYCQKNKITQNVFFTSVMGYVVGKYMNSDSACYTAIYNGRDSAKTAGMMGMLVKTLPVYAELDESLEVVKYLSRMQTQLLNSMSNDIYSFAEISREYNVKADVLFAYQGDDFVEFELGGQKTVFSEGLSDTAQAPLSIDLFVENGVYRYEFEYRSDMYSEDFIKRMYEILVEAAKSFLYAKTLGDVNITSKEQLALIESFNETEYPVEPVSVNRLFESNVKKHPDMAAVIADGETLTYDELNRCANRLAHALLGRGLKIGDMAGLILERDKNVYIARQGILKAGGAFLPMVPEYPDERIDFCLKDADCPFVITTERIKAKRSALLDDKPYKMLTMEELLACEDESDPDLDIPADSLAYCLYTSGSTGKPKGVMIEHRNLCNFVNANPKNLEVKCFPDNGHVSLALAAITFDVSVMEEFIPLCNSMTICMANEDEIHNPLELADLMIKNGVDVMSCTPSFLTNIIDIPEVHPAIANIKMFDLGAEAFPSMLYDKLRAVNKDGVIVNGYGPTEATISCIAKIMESGRNITIGKPSANVRAYIVDRQNKILPVGISGELVLCGDGVGRGYVNLPEKNKEAFFNFKGMKAYHSGDMARWTADGEIDFQGRLDNQVKLRGLRVELDEIENAMNNFAGIKMSKVVVKNNGSEEFLAGYFTAESQIDTAALTEHLKSTLTYYMVPGSLMQLERMPLTANGKIDKKKLPDIKYTAQKREYVAPSTALEKEFCDKFAEILSMDQVSATDNFFEIGGTSLSATRIAMYGLTKGYPIVYKDIFANPTPAALAKFIEGSGKETEKSSEICDYDYSEIKKLLAGNSLNNVDSVKKGELGNILLTGATGFLGIHVLKEALIQSTATVYCLVRKGKYPSCEKRLMNMLMYYFEKTYQEAFGSRIICIDGDITDRDMMLSLAGLDFKSVINCAACVKHFVQDDMLDKINVEGVKNIIGLCEKGQKRLIQISTVSVAGEGNSKTVPESRHIRENDLYFGQIVENDYVRTKFLAERAVLEAVARDGLDAKIIRVGNLMSRKSDGEFQINFVTNGFMKTLKGYQTLKKFPLGAMHDMAEFSPIDSTAEAILALASSENNFTVFHGYNSHQIYMSDVIWAMRDYGFDIEVVSDAEFEEALKEAADQAEKSDAVLGLIAYNSDDEERRYEIPSDNRFTVEVLYRLGYKWPITDDAYMEHAIRALDEMEFFKC